MPHADSSLVPSTIPTRNAFWDHVYEQLESLLGEERNWVSNLSNAASLIYNSLLAFPTHFGSDERAVNWCGFYLDARLLPGKQPDTRNVLLLAPFSGKPACQFIRAQAGKGVCADAYVSRKPVLVPNVDEYPGHIACDGETKSEAVLPLLYRASGSDEEIALGVLDLDCLALNGFEQDDIDGLQKIAALIVSSCDWE